MLQNSCYYNRCHLNNKPCRFIIKIEYCVITQTLLTNLPDRHFSLLPLENLGVRTFCYYSSKKKTLHFLEDSHTEVTDISILKLCVDVHFSTPPIPLLTLKQTVIYLQHYRTRIFPGGPALTLLMVCKFASAHRLTTDFVVQKNFPYHFDGRRGASFSPSDISPYRLGLLGYAKLSAFEV